MLPNDALKALELQQVRHAALHKPVKLAAPASPHYAGAGPAGLVNGLRGTTDFQQPEWLGFEGPGLGGHHRPRPAHADHRIGRGIPAIHRRGHLPAAAHVEFSLSDDGVSFHRVAEAKPRPRPATPARWSRPSPLRGSRPAGDTCGFAQSISAHCRRATARPESRRGCL